MRTFVRRFCAALAVAGFASAFALGGDGPPPLPTPVPPDAPKLLPAPVPAELVNTDAPIELPGLPPLPPPDDAGAAGEPIRAAPTCRPWGGLFVDAEYLYLKPYRSDLNFAILSPNTNGDPEGPIVSDPLRSRNAFRVGAGYRLPDDGWEVGFYYTYLHDDDGAFATQPANGLLFATQTHPGTVEFAGSALADATLAYNVYDLEVGRRLNVGDSLSVRPFGGLRFAQIDQNFSVLYNGGDANLDTTGSHLQFNGGGLRAGAQADWTILEHLSLYGRGAGSLMVGDSRVGQTEFNNGGATTLTDASESFRKIVPVMELAAGVAYQRGNVRLSLGYEVTNWFNLIDSPVFVNDVHQGKFLNNVSDLGVDGFAARVEFNY